MFEEKENQNGLEECISKGNEPIVVPITDEKKLENVGQQIKDKFGMEEFDVEVKKIEEA